MSQQKGKPEVKIVAVFASGVGDAEPGSAKVVGYMPCIFAKSAWPKSSGLSNQVAAIKEFERFAFFGPDEFAAYGLLTPVTAQHVYDNARVSPVGSSLFMGTRADEEIAVEMGLFRSLNS